MGNPPGFVNGGGGGGGAHGHAIEVCGDWWALVRKVQGSEVVPGVVRISQPIRKVHLIQPNAPKSLQWSLFPDSTPIL